MAGTVWLSVVRRWGCDLAMLAAIGLLMGFLGPFGSDRAPILGRYTYWMICMVGGGIIAVLADDALTPRIPSIWRRVVLGSVLMTPPVSLLVLSAEHIVMGGRIDVDGFLRLWWQVWPILIAVMAVRALVWRQLPVKVETRTVVTVPLPATEAAFRKRLSARRRTARLIAVEAHDHYLKVHTDAGEELITLRFSDALVELAQAHGWQVHRSWWVAAPAVEQVRWRRGTGELRLTGGLIAPVSRQHAATVKEAGWF